MLYRLIRILMRFTLRLFFRRIDVEGRHQVPSSGPILFVANHSNALVDPLIIMTAISRELTITAKNVLADNVLLRWLMAACGVVTFHRAKDVGQGARRRQNLQSVRRCLEILTGGGAVCVFPEGVSHSDAKLRAFRPGVGHIALDYVRNGGDKGRLQIVPVGLLYAAKDQFRSDVWLRFGDPLDAESWLARHPQGRPVDLTREIERRVTSLTINAPSRGEQLLLTWAAEIVATRAQMPKPLGADEQSTVERFQLVSQLQAGRTLLKRDRPAALKELSDRIRTYRRQLRRAGIKPSEVFLPLGWGRAAFFLLREIELLFLGGPLALFGALNHLAPYLVVKSIATKTSRDKDHWASNVIYASFVVFPLFYLVQLAAAWLLLPTWWAIVYTAALPYTGYYAVRYGDRFRLAWRRARTFLYLAFRPDQQRLLAAEGCAIVQEVRALSQIVEREQKPAVCNRPGAGQALSYRSAADLEQPS